jgi:hypothetical protein
MNDVGAKRCVIKADVYSGSFAAVPRVVHILTFTSVSAARWFS